VDQQEQLVEDVRQALTPPRWWLYAQGFWEMAAGQRRDMAGHRPGCHGRPSWRSWAASPGPDFWIASATPTPRTRLCQPACRRILQRRGGSGPGGWRRVIGTAASIACRFLAFLCPRLLRPATARAPAGALIQGSARLFRRHTYRRVEPRGVPSTPFGRRPHRGARS